MISLTLSFCVCGPAFQSPDSTLLSSTTLDASVSPERRSRRSCPPPLVYSVLVDDKEVDLIISVYFKSSNDSKNKSDHRLIGYNEFATMTIAFFLS